MTLVVIANAALWFVEFGDAGADGGSGLPTTISARRVGRLHGATVEQQFDIGWGDDFSSISAAKLELRHEWLPGGLLSFSLRRKGAAEELMPALISALAD